MYSDGSSPRENDRVTTATCYQASMLSRDRYMEHYNEVYDDMAVVSA
jgi:hypothetical protein